jgi:hypothetical protein
MCKPYQKMEERAGVEPARDFHPYVAFKASGPANVPTSPKARCDARQESSCT